MMKLIITIVGLLGICFAQPYQTPNYNEISKLINSEGENNYKTLLAKLTNNDTLLNKDQYFILYYGQVLQENYSPTSLNQQLSELAKNKNFEEYITVAKEHLKSAPFDLRTRNSLVNLLYEKNDPDSKIYYHALDGFLTAIFGSGNGKSKETALYVLSPSDEYVILNILSLSFNKRWADPPYDIFELKENKYAMQHIYFNLTKYFEKLNDLFKK
jgi:hypothetical protein